MQDNQLVTLSNYDEQHHHVEKRLAFPGADTETVFNQLFGTDAILTFAAVSWTITAFRTVAQLFAGAFYHWILPATSGPLRESLEQMTFLKNRQALAFSVYLNPAIWLFIMTGRITIDFLLFGVEDTLKGLRSRTFEQLFNFVFSDRISKAFLGRMIFEGIGLIFGWAFIRAVVVMAQGAGAVANGRRRRRHLQDIPDVEGEIDKRYQKIVATLESSL